MSGRAGALLNSQSSAPVFSSSLILSEFDPLFGISSMEAEEREEDTAGNRFSLRRRRRAKELRGRRRK